MVEDDTKLAGVLKQGLKEQGFAVDVTGEAAAGLATDALEADPLRDAPHD